MSHCSYIMLLLIIFIFKKMIDVIEMILYVSSVGFKDSLNDRRISFKNICLMDKRYVDTFLIQCKLQLRAHFFLLNSSSFHSFQIVKLVVWDISLTTNLIAWNRCTSQITVVVGTMLCSNHLGNFIILFSSQQFKNNLLH
jgi:hypothetical protein